MRTTLRWLGLPLLMLGLCAPLVNAADDDAELRKKALKLNQITGTEAMSAQLRSFAKDEAGTKKLIAVAIEMVKDKEQPFNYNAAIILARVSQAFKEFKASEKFYRLAAEKATLLQSTEKLVQVYDGLIDLSFESNKFDDAVRVAQEFLDLQGNEQLQRIKPFVMERLIQAKAKQGKIDEAMKLTQNLIDADEDGWYFVNLKAWVLREADKLEESAQTYEDVLKRLRRSDLEDEVRERYAERTRYILSSVFVDMKKIDKAAEQLQTLLKKKPDDPTYNNDLGYIWADNDMNLEEAEKLIRKAIDEDKKLNEKLPPELAKDNPAYLDSLGWVLYKKKNYAEAKKYLLKAIEDKEGQHIEIMDHLADVHVALGEKKEAIAVWEKSLKLENLTKREEKRKLVVEEKLKKLKSESK